MTVTAPGRHVHDLHPLGAREARVDAAERDRHVGDRRPLDHHGHAPAGSGRSGRARASGPAGCPRRSARSGSPRRAAPRPRRSPRGPAGTSPISVRMSARAASRPAPIASRTSRIDSSSSSRRTTCAPRCRPRGGPLLRRRSRRRRRRGGRRARRSRRRSPRAVGPTTQIARAASFVSMPTFFRRACERGVSADRLHDGDRLLLDLARRRRGSPVHLAAGCPGARRRPGSSRRSCGCR